MAFPTPRSSRIAAAAGACLLVAAAIAAAQGRPGLDRPIRVGMLNGVGTGVFNHTNLHTASSVVAALLAAPWTGNLGDSLVIPNAGFSFYSMPVSTNTSGTMCSGTGCGPSPGQLDTIVAALDTLDVLIMNSNTGIGNLITNSAHREAFEAFWVTKGLVSIHATTDSKGAWEPLDSINGTRFNNHPAEQVATIRRDSVHESDPAWKYLNRGIFSNGADTSITEEWLFYTHSGAEIRARDNLKPTVKLIETGMTGIASLGMGDHPTSWYRPFPTGGRTFYTGIGHRAQTWQNTRVFRRQLYNAILWTAKYDSIGEIVSLNPGYRASAAARELFRLRSMPGALAVSMLTEGGHSVELLSMNGRRIEMRQGFGRETTHVFSGLMPGVYIVSMKTRAGVSSRLATVTR